MNSDSDCSATDGSESTWLDDQLFTRENSQELTTLGYTVVKDVLTATEVDTAKDMFYAWRAVNPFPTPAHGIIKHYSIGHTGFAWYIRTRETVQSVFASIWGTKDLVVSYDGACYLPPGFSRRNTTWLHVDQAPKHADFRCVQGFIALTTNEQSTLEVVPGSHLTWGSYCRRLGLCGSKAWVKIPEPMSTVKVPAAAGDLVLWDSRLVHQNQYGTGDERMVQYLSYLPRHAATKTQLKKRSLYYNDRKTTSHWAYPQTVNSLQPQTYGDPSRKIDYSTVVDPYSYMHSTLVPEINKLI